MIITKKTIVKLTLLFSIFCHYSYASEIVTNIQQPTSVYLTKYTKKINNRLLMQVKFGNSIPISMVMDTGSSGVVVNCAALLNNQLFNVNGEQLNGNKLCQRLSQSTLVLPIHLSGVGIDITKQVIKKTYGTRLGRPHTVEGFLAYAQLTLMDARHRVITQNMPFLLAYQYHCHANGCGTLGISTGNVTKQIISPIYYLQFGKGIQPGFILYYRNNSQQQNGLSYITLGIDSQNNQGFNNIQLKQRTKAVNGLSFWSPFIKSEIILTDSNITKTFYPIKTLIDSGVSVPTFCSQTASISQNDLKSVQINILQCNNQTCEIQLPRKIISTMHLNKNNFRLRVVNTPCADLNTSINFFMAHDILYNFATGVIGIK
jgi:hypothetical protein